MPNVNGSKAPKRKPRNREHRHPKPVPYRQKIRQAIVAAIDEWG